MNSRSTVAHKASLSEYTHDESLANHVPEEYVPASNTLFDDETFKEVEHTVDTRNVSYAEARTIVGVETPFYETPKDPELDLNPGVSVSLGARALALEEIMSTFNYLSRAAGAHKIIEHQDNDFEPRYSNPDIVIQNMDRKAAAMERKAESDYSILNATNALIDAGYDPKLAIQQEKQMKNKIIDTYGPGKMHAPDRAKIMRKVMKVAKNAS